MHLVIARVRGIGQLTTLPMWLILPVRVRSRAPNATLKITLFKERYFLLT